MSKTSISQFSTAAASNTDIGGINVNTGWSPSNVGPAFRTLMSYLADNNFGQAIWNEVAISNVSGTSGIWTWNTDTANPADLLLSFTNAGGTVTGTPLTITPAGTVDVGNLAVTGTATLGGPLSVAGTLTAPALTVSGAGITNVGTLANTGNASVSGNLNVTGTAAIVGALTLSAALAVPTASTSDSSTTAANTSWVRSAMSNIAAAAGFSVNFAATGHIALPSWLGGFILNWGYASYTSNGGIQGFTIAVDKSYPNNHLWAMGAIGTNGLGAVFVGAAPNNGTSITFESVSNAGGIGVLGYWLSLGY